MAIPRTHILSDAELRAIHGAALRVLHDTGVRVHHEGVVTRLREHDAMVDPNHQVVRLPEDLVMRSVGLAGKAYVLHGRDRSRTARFGHGELNLMSSPGQQAWLDSDTGDLRSPTMADARAGIRLGEALPNLTIVGALAQPGEVPAAVADVVLASELVRGTTKPTRGWVQNGATARHVLELYRTVAGGSENLRRFPMTETFLEPVSPLQMPRDGLDAVIEFVRAGQPVSINPMSMTSGTAPGTLAGTLVLEHAEFLAGNTMVQALGPGTPVLYGGIPHILDPRTSVCSFGSPEQGLLAVAMAQLGRFLGFPVYVNVGLTDAKTLDAQAGIEKSNSLILGVLAGADLVGHAGICGPDHGASLEWLVLDDDLMAFAKRVARGLEVSPETLAADVIRSVGPGGHYLAEEHTVRHYRRELWIPGPAWTRHGWKAWVERGRCCMADRIRSRVHDLLAQPPPPPLEPSLAAELDRIVASARKELL
jgi:trimethylamine---corrinoid protein Co-methyltransferase